MCFLQALLERYQTAQLDLFDETHSRFFLADTKMLILLLVFLVINLQ